MRRRTFVKQAMRASVVLPVLSSNTVFSQSLPVNQVFRWQVHLANRISDCIARQLIGYPRRVSVMRIYSADTKLSVKEALTIARQDLQQCFLCLQTSTSFDLPAFTDPVAMQFGSYCLQLEHQGIRILWQALAHAGMSASSTPTLTLEIQGTQGQLSTTKNGDDVHVKQFGNPV